jgi:hypothetical protein
MGLTKRVQVLMEPGDFAELSKVARRKRVSVAELLRRSATEKYLRCGDHVHAVVDEIEAMELPVEDWATMKGEIEEMADDRLP